MPTAEEIIATLKPEEKIVVVNDEPLFVVEKAEDVIIAILRYAAERGLRKWRCLDTRGRCTERMVVIGIKDVSRLPILDEPSLSMSVHDRFICSH